MKREAIVSLDIGGTNCRIGLVDQEYAIYEQKTLSTIELVEKGFVDELVSLIQEYRTDFQSQFHIHAASLGFPSTIDRTRTRLLSTPNIEGLDNLPIADILEEKLKLPVYLERDVNLLLTYDLNYFRLTEEAVVAGIYFGTGIGNAIYIDGHLLYGRNGVAGELGHIPQLYSHVKCGCGNPSCIEPVGGGRCLEELCSGRFRGTQVRDIYTMHRHTKEIERQVEAMAVPVASEINILDPDYVILGGGLLQMADFPLELLESSIHKYVRKPYPLQNLRLVYSNTEQENGVIGAGIYGWQKWMGNERKKSDV